MEKKKENIRINRFNLWILIGFCWLIPQLIIRYLPEELQIIKPIILILLGFFIIFDKGLDKLFIEKKTTKKKDGKTKKI